MPSGTGHHVGGTKHFECRVTGHPRPKIRWFKDSREITDNPRYKFDHSHDGVISMVIENIQHRDEGSYRCRAENSQGLASTGAYLFVRDHKEHPEESNTSVHAMEIEEVYIKDKYGRGARREGEEPHFQTAIKDVDDSSKKVRRLSAEEEEIVRKSFEQVIESADSSKIVLTGSVTKVSSESQKIGADLMEKSYHSSDSEQESRSLLMEKTGRIIKGTSETTQETSQETTTSGTTKTSKQTTVTKTTRTTTVTSSSTTSSSTTAIEGSEETEEELKAIEISDSKEKVTKQDSKEKDDTEVKTSEKTSSWVEQVSSEADDTKNGKPKVKQGPPAKLEVEEGKTLRITTVIEGTTRVTWTRNRQIIKTTKRITMVTERDMYTLEIREVGPEDAGTYRITASNSSGEIFSDIPVTVTCAKQDDGSLNLAASVGLPKFTEQPQDLSVVEFEPLRIVCSIAGDPTPSVTWERNGKKLVSSKRMRIYEEKGSYFVEIPEAEASDAGEYTCAAANTHGTVSAKMKVTVKGADASDQGAKASDDVTDSADVCTSVDPSTTHYVKLACAAAAFSLAAFGMKRVLDSLAK